MTKEEKEQKELVDRMLASELNNNEKVSTGIIELDALLSGGLSYSTLTQLVGEASTGKTFMSLQIAYSFCKQGKQVLFIDTKNDVNNEILQMTKLTEYKGNRFLYICETKFRTVEKIVEAILNERKLDLLIVDSIAGLTNSGYLNLGSKGIKVDNNNSNYDSRPLSLLTNKIKKLSIDKAFCVLFTNEFRNKIQMYGNKGTVTKIYGPKKLQYESTNIIQINQLKASEKDEYCKQYKDLFKPLQNNNLGKLQKLQIIKSNISQQDKILPIYFEYGLGYSNLIPIVFMLYMRNVIKNSGSYYELKRHNIKTNGIVNFLEEFKRLVGNQDYSNSKELHEYYKLVLNH